MFKSCVSSASRSVTASTSSSFHTAAILQAARRQGQSAKKQNVERSLIRKREQAENVPSVVLGTRSQEETQLWPKSDLAKCLVDLKVVNAPLPPIQWPSDSSPSDSFDSPTSDSFGSPTSDPSDSSSNSNPEAFEEIDISTLKIKTIIPRNLNYGIGEVEKELLLKDLPALSALAPILASQSNFTSVFKVSGSSSSSSSQQSSEVLKDRQIEAAKKEAQKVEAFARVLDLRNASAKGIAYENRRRIILEFSTAQNPFDPGRAEVQAAILTYEIRNLWNHLTTFKRDVGNRLGLRKLVHQRAKILRYLKSKDQDRYEALLPRLALDPKSVEGELVV